MSGTKPHFGTILNDCLDTVSATQLVNLPTPLQPFETELYRRDIYGISYTVQSLV